ncbi:ATP-binding cassette domain-containing protein, partial [Mycobacterium stomatepiae]|uniref:ATP-binding cassette domain-containing protein n=1 Tax=Mycobacterium stomatepiae TaxID=470076 RepID=UPI0021F2C882
MTDTIPERALVSLEARDIHKTLGGAKVLRGVTFEAPAGTTVAVIGPSGSGKSTLLRALNRLHEPDKGDILLDGRSVLDDDPDELRQRIGMVFQHYWWIQGLVATVVSVGVDSSLLRRLVGLSQLKRFRGRPLSSSA